MLEDRYGRDGFPSDDPSFPKPDDSPDLVEIRRSLRSIGFFEPRGNSFPDVSSLPELLRLGSVDVGKLGGFFNDRTPAIIVAADSSFYQDRDERPEVTFRDGRDHYDRWRGTLNIETGNDRVTSPFSLKLALNPEAKYAVVEISKWGEVYQKYWGEVFDDKEGVLVAGIRSDWATASLDMAFLEKGWEERLFATEQPVPEPEIRATLRSRYTPEQIEGFVRKAHEQGYRSQSGYDEEPTPRRRNRGFQPGLSADQITSMLAGVTVTDERGKTHSVYLGPTENRGDTKGSGKYKDKFARKAAKKKPKKESKKTKK